MYLCISDYKKQLLFDLINTMDSIFLGLRLGDILVLILIVILFLRLRKNESKSSSREEKIEQIIGDKINSSHQDLFNKSIETPPLHTRVEPHDRCRNPAERAGSSHGASVSLIRDLDCLLIPVYRLFTALERERLHQVWRLQKALLLLCFLSRPFLFFSTARRLQCQKYQKVLFSLYPPPE